VKLAKDLREFIELLNSNGVEYLIVGGHAVAFHGYPRFTGDIDIFVRASADNAAKVLSALDAFGFGGLDMRSTISQPKGRSSSLGSHRTASISLP
jgi:hypothetical protein